MLGVIGGSGFYEMDGAEVVEQREVSTPYGAPSAPLTFVRVGGHSAVFLPRHGGGHGLLPSEINYRANIWALKASGVRQLISVSAVGSLREDIAPGDFALPSQYLGQHEGLAGADFFWRRVNRACVHGDAGLFCS